MHQCNIYRKCFGDFATRSLNIRPWSKSEGCDWPGRLLKRLKQLSCLISTLLFSPLLVHYLLLLVSMKVLWTKPHRHTKYINTKTKQFPTFFLFIEDGSSSLPGEASYMSTHGSRCKQKGKQRSLWRSLVITHISSQVLLFCHQPLSLHFASALSFLVYFCEQNKT